MGTIKDRHVMDLTEIGDIRSGGKNTQKTIQNDFNDPDNHDGVINHLEPDIQE